MSRYSEIGRNIKNSMQQAFWCSVAMLALQIKSNEFISDHSFQIW